MREAKQKKYWGLLALLTFVIIVVLGYFVLYPQTTELKNLDTQVQAKNQENQALSAKIKALNSLSQSFTANPDKVRMLDLAIPNDDLQAEIIASLGNIAGSSGMTITNISQVASDTEDFTSINLGFETSYAGLKLFLGSIENNMRYIDIKNMTLTRAVKAEGAEGFITGSAKLDLFKYAGSVPSVTSTVAPVEGETP